MRLVGRRLFFDDAQDFMNFFSNMAQFPEGAFETVLIPNTPGYIFDIVDDEAYVLIKLVV